MPPVPFPWRCLALLNFAVVSAAPAVSLQDPAGQELILLSLAINAAMMGPFALVENEPPVTIDAGWVEEINFTIKKPWGNDTHMLHVWYIYLHLGDFEG